MSTAGLSRARLGRMHDVMAGYVERGEVPGLVTLVSRRGEVHVDVIGTKAFAEVLLQKFKLSEMMVGSCANGKDAVNSAVF